MHCAIRSDSCERYAAFSLCQDLCASVIFCMRTGGPKQTKKRRRDKASFSKDLPALNQSCQSKASIVMYASRILSMQTSGRSFGFGLLRLGSIEFKSEIRTILEERDQPMWWYFQAWEITRTSHLAPFSGEEVPATVLRPVDWNLLPLGGSFYQCAAWLVFGFNIFHLFSVHFLTLFLTLSDLLFKFTNLAVQ